MLAIVKCVLLFVCLFHSSTASMKNCCAGQRLVIGMPSASSPPFVIYNGIPSGSQTSPSMPSYTGFVPELLEDLSHLMGLELKYVTMHGVEYITSGSVIDNITDGGIDAAAIWPDGSEASMPAVTVPLLHDQFTVLIRRSKVQRSLWAFTQSFSTQLWFYLVAIVFGYSFVLQIIRVLGEKERKPAKDLLMPSAIMRSFYHTWAAILGGDDFEYTTWPARILRLGLLFLVMIITATYTANLAAFFVAPQHRLHGPVDIEGLQKSRACYTYEEWGSAIVPFVDELVYPPADAATFDERMQYCHDLLMKDEVTALVEGETVLAPYALDHCGDTSLQRGISFATYFYSLLLASDARRLHLASNINAAMLEISVSRAHQERMKNWFGKGSACHADDEPETLNEVSADSMGGTFIVSSVIAVVALLAGVLERLCPTCYPKRRSSIAETEGEMLLQVLKDLQELKEMHQEAIVTREPLPPSV